MVALAALLPRLLPNHDAAQASSAAAPLAGTPLVSESTPVAPPTPSVPAAVASSAPAPSTAASVPTPPEKPATTPVTKRAR